MPGMNWSHFIGKIRIVPAVCFHIVIVHNAGNCSVKVFSAFSLGNLREHLLGAGTIASSGHLNMDLYSSGIDSSKSSLNSLQWNGGK